MNGKRPIDMLEMKQHSEIKGFKQTLAALKNFKVKKEVSISSHHSFSFKSILLEPVRTINLDT
jgi:hypothetical protein